MKTSLQLFLFTFFLMARCLAQPYYFKRYEVEDGLSTNTVYASLQDKRGFLWFGTVDGLNRFDGYTFKVFRMPKGHGYIENGQVNSLCEDKKGTLWAGTPNGLFRYDALLETFTLVKSTANLGITNLNTDEAGDVWFMSNYKIFTYHVKTNRLHLYDSKNAIDATSLCISPEGSIWVGTATGLVLQFDVKKKAFTSFDVFSHSKSPSSRSVLRIFDANNQFLLIGTSNQGVKLFNKRTKAYQDILTYNRNKAEIYVRDFVHNTGDEYWIATELGIFIYNLSTKKVINLVKDNTNPYSISDNAVYTLCKDREGGIWVGSFFGGLNYYPKQYNQFEKFFPLNNDSTISGNAVREICKDKHGNIWVGTEDAGLNKFNPVTGVFTHFLTTGSKTDISYNNIHGLLAHGNELWIGTFEHGLDIMDIRTHKIIRHYKYGTDSNSFKSNFIVTFLKTRNGRIYVGTTKGLYLYNEDKKNFSHVSLFPNDYRPFVYSFFEDHAGNIWIGTISDGLFSINVKTGQKRHFLNDTHNNRSLNSNRVNGIFESHNRVLWLATEGGGLCRFDSKSNSFKSYTTENGLPSNFIFKILEDSHDNLWISTSKGLVCFNPATEKFKIFSKSNGLLNDQFNYNSAFKDPSTGYMYFGSVKGLIRFNPDKFTTNTYIPNVYITGFQIYNKELSINKDNSPLKKSISLTDTITLSYNQSSFNINFAALSFTAPETTEYAYMMEGLDNRWTYLKTNRQAYYTELDPGTYTFRVRAANTSGIWSKKDIRLVIRIQPPVWKSPAAYVFYIVLALSILSYLMRRYDRRLKEKNRRKLELLSHKKEKEVYQAKINFFTNVAHEIRTPLTLIKGPMEKVINQVEEVPSIKKNLLIMERNTERLLELTEQLLDFRRVETDSFSLNFTRVDVVELLNDLILRFEPAAEQKSIILKVDLPAKAVNVYTDIEAFNKILSNLISNAIKYCDKHVVVSLTGVSEEKDEFVIEVKSDGIHIPADMTEKIFDPFFRVKETQKQAGTGLGLALSRSLAQLLLGSLILDTSQLSMNVFVLTLPARLKDHKD